MKNLKEVIKQATNPEVPTAPVCAALNLMERLEYNLFLQENSLKLLNEELSLIRKEIEKLSGTL